MCVYEAADIVRGAIEVFRAVDMYQEVQETKAQSEIETRTFISEAKTVERQAAVERQEGIEESRRQKLSSILNMQKEKTMFAANNIATTSQTTLNILGDENLNGELMALNTLEEAENRSDNYLSKAKDYYNKASLSSFKGKQAYKKALLKNLEGEAAMLVSNLGG